MNSKTTWETFCDIQSEWRAAAQTLAAMGYTYHGGEQWKPPIGKAPDFDMMDRLRAGMQEAAQAYNHFRARTTKQEHVLVQDLNALVAADEALAAQLDPHHTEAEQLAMLEGARALIAAALAMRQEQPADSKAKAAAHYQEMARLAELPKNDGATWTTSPLRDSHFFLAGWNGARDRQDASEVFKAADIAARGAA